MLYFIANFLLNIVEAVFMRDCHSFLIVMFQVALLTEEHQPRGMSGVSALLFSESVSVFLHKILAIWTQVFVFQGDFLL